MYACKLVAETHAHKGDDMAADVDIAIRERRSIRKYSSSPVPEGLMRELLDEARWAPSWGNTQSTHVYVLAGSTLLHLKTRLRERLESEMPPDPDITMPAAWPDYLQSRITRLLETRVSFLASETARAGETPPPALPPLVQMAGLFGAPCLLVFAIDEDIPEGYGCFDAGLLVQTVALAAHARGLGTCIMTMAARYPSLVREVVPAVTHKKVVIGLTIGYPDTDAAVNRFPRDRVAVEEFVHFAG